MLQSFASRRNPSFHGDEGDADNDDDNEEDEEDESSAGELPNNSNKGLRGFVDHRHSDHLQSDGMSTAVSDGGLSDFGYLDNQTIGDNSVEEVAFDALNREIQAMIQEKPVRSVIKLCFSSMAVVFRETILNRDPDLPPFQYNRLTSIPTAAARMLWSELLGGIECSLSGKTNEYVAKVAPGDFGGELDESISTSILRGFLSAVNRKENKALALLRTGKNLFKRKENDDSVRNIRSIEAMEEKKKSKDPFLYFVKQQLLKAELVELSGRRFYDSIQSHGDINLWDEDDEDASVESMNDDEMDISGWKDQKRARLSQSMLISREMHHKYGLTLSRRLVKAGGFALPDSGQETYSGSQGDATMRRWDERMADACARKLHRHALLEPRVVEQENREEMEIDEEPWMKAQSNNPFGDGTTYALKMYPTHLMRGGCVVDAARTLMAPRFFLGRVIIFGVLKACQRHRSDLEELCLRSELALEGQFELGGDGAGIDAEDISFAAFHVMSSVVTGRYEVPSEQPIPGKNKASDTQMADAGRAMHLIANLFAEKGDFAQAIDCFMKSYKFKNAAFGPDHPSVARTYMHLGQCYVREREFDDAIVWFSQALRIEREQKVANSERVTSALASLALVYGLLNDHDKAVELYSESLEIVKETLGSDHVKVADNLNSLGIVYGLMGDLDKAAQYYLDAIAIKENQEIVYDEQIADLRFNLGLVYGKRGDNAAALSCFEDVLRVRRERYGDDDKDVGKTYHHIGEALADLGRLDDALENFEEAYRIRKGVLGDEHEDVSETLQCMGLVYYEHSDLEMALSFLEDALRIFQRRFGLRSEKAADSLHAMGLVYHAQNNYDQAVRSFLEALQIRQACLGEEHLDVASTRHNLGDVYFMQGDMDAAMVEYTKARRIREKQLGEMHEDVSATLNNMGVVLMKQGDQVEAMECLDKALSIRQNLFGRDHVKCSDTLHNMGLVHKCNHDYELAIEKYEEATRIRRLEEHDQIKVADTLYNMAIVYCKMGSYSRGLSICQKVQEIYRNSGLPDDHSSVVHTQQWIKWSQKKLAKLSAKAATASG